MKSKKLSDPTLQVIIVENLQTTIGIVTLLSISKRDGTEIKENWDYLQNVKSEIFGEDAQAFEVYPKKKKVVNKMNIRHLWVLPSDYKIPFGLGNDFMDIAAKKVEDDFNDIIGSHRTVRL